MSKARKEIWATKRQFERIFNQGLTALAGYSGQGAKVSHSFFLDMEKTISQAFAQIEKDLGTIDPNEAIDAPGGGVSPVLEIIEDAASVANWFFDKISLRLSSTLGVSIVVPSAILKDVQALIAQIQSAFVNEIASLIRGFLGRMQALVTSTQEFSSWCRP